MCTTHIYLSYTNYGILHNCTPLYNICIQEKEQHDFFKKPNASKPDKNDKDDTDKDDDNITPPRRRHKNDKSDTYSSSSSSDDDLASDLKRISDKKEKKLRKDITISVNSPLSLGLKYLITDNIARAASNESAIVLRSIKPVTATINNILKNNRLLDWDHPLLLAAIKAIFEHQINLLKSRRKEKLAQKLESDAKALICLLVEDQLLLTPRAVHATFNTLFTRDQHCTDILNLYKQQRETILSEAVNRQKSISRITGHCIGYNFKSDCDNASCGFLHHCILHNDPQQHKTMLCNDNPNRWKKPPFKPNDNRNNKRRGRNRFNRYNNYNYQNQMNIPPPNQPMLNHHPFVQFQYPQHMLPPPHMNDKRGNKDRYNFFPQKK